MTNTYPISRAKHILFSFSLSPYQFREKMVETKAERKKKESKLHANQMPFKMNAEEKILKKKQ